MKHKVLPLFVALLAVAVLVGCTARAEQSPGGSTENQTKAPAAPANPPAVTPPATAPQPTPPPSQPQPGSPGAKPADIAATLTAPAQLERAQGKPAVFAMELRNNTAAMTITYNSGQQYDFWVEQNGKVIWRWSDGRMFTQVVTNQTFNADGVLHFEVQWDGRGSNGKPVPPGSYMVHARWTAHTELASTPQPAPIAIKVR
ncbi:MAG: BsuPI-related putative proteinase inhibitor [Symbiobacteriia bacterium]